MNAKQFSKRFKQELNKHQAAEDQPIAVWVTPEQVLAILDFWGVDVTAQRDEFADYSTLALPLRCMYQPELEAMLITTFEGDELKAYLKQLED